MNPKDEIAHRNEGKILNPVLLPNLLEGSSQARNFNSNCNESTIACRYEFIQNLRGTPICSDTLEKTPERVPCCAVIAV